MEIRVLREEELIHAAGLSRYVFDTCLRNRMEFTQTIPYVENYISESNLKRMTNEERLVVFGAFEGEQLVGIGGLQRDGMITLLYVLPQYTKRACGSHLLAVMKGYAKDVLQLESVRVNATPAWTFVYFKKNGFVLTDSNQNMYVPFVPMYSFLEKAGYTKKEKISGKTILAAIFICLGFSTIVGAWFMITYLLG